MTADTPPDETHAGETPKPAAGIVPTPFTLQTSAPHTPPSNTDAVTALSGKATEQKTPAKPGGRNERGQFIKGFSGGPGRKRGSRNRLGDAFLDDLRDTWAKHGKTALNKCAKDDPVAFVRVVASLMPKDVNLNLTADAASFANAFQDALTAIGGDASRIPRRTMKLIEHRDTEYADG